MITTIKPWGNSQGLRFSKKVLSQIGVSVNDDVDIEVSEDKIIITKANKKEIDLRELFKDYKGNYELEEYDYGKPKGKEVW